jgi:release factor glutamine methyltransferase
MMRGVFAAGMTVAAARRRLADALRREEFDTPDLDARVLVAYALGLDHAGLIRNAERTLHDDEAERIAACAERRLRREPVARIVGVKEFWSLPLAVTGATLVPRPETETVVEAALAAVDERSGRDGLLRLLDIGTGSGALLLALLAELPHALGVGTDADTAALGVARGNAVRLGLAGRAQFVACDLAAALTGPFDLIVSNPPYVASEEIATLAPGVRDYDPRLALDGGADGLDAYRALAAQVTRVLAPRGHIVVELGAGQADAVAAILRPHGLVTVALAADIGGTIRALTAVAA